MPATTAPLVVEIFKAPNKAKKIAEETQKLIVKILSQLKYGGRWGLTLNNQLTKREDFRFKVVERRGHQIICRTKPGDNGTCWQITLYPPKGYLMDQIFSDLRMVPPSGEMMKIPVISPATATMPLNSGGRPLEIFSQMEKASPIAIPLAIPVKDRIETPVPAAPIPELAAPPASVESKAAPTPRNHEASGENKLENQTKNGLELDAKIQVLGDSNMALTHGLVAVCMGIGPDGSILRQMAVKILVQELNLEDFVRNNSNYNDPVKAATVLVSALCDKGYFGRWASPMRKQNRVRETTKGYLLTPHGRAKLEAYRPHLPQSVQERLFQPDKMVIVKDMIVPPEEEEVRSNEPQKPFAAKFEQLAPLMEKFKERQAAVADCDTLILDLTQQRSAVERDLSPLEHRYETLKAEMMLLQGDLEKLKAKRDKISGDLTAAEQLKEAENIAFEEVREHLQQIIAS
jgi:hypothetical protein